MKCDHGWNVETARNDRRVRCRATQIGYEAGETVLLEDDHVGWGQVMCDQNGILFRNAAHDVSGAPKQSLEHTLHDMVNICLAFA